MERLPRGVYTKEFRDEAVKFVIEGGITLLEAGRRLSLPPSTLAYWVKASKSGKGKEVGKPQRQFSEVEIEIAKVRKELAEAKMERDFLKKAAAYFAKESR